MSNIKRRRLLKFTAFGFAIILIMYIGISIYGAIKAMEIPRLPLKDSPSSVGLNYEDVSFTSHDDGAVLRGWYLASKREHVIIIVNGGYENRLDANVDTLGLANDLVNNGYDVLLFDLRGRGESEGKGLALSNIERDIGGAVDYIKDEGYSSKSIYIIAYCSGAASACIFASQNSIGALVLDGCFATVHNMVIRQAELMGIPKFLVNFFIPGILLMTKIIYSYDLVNPIDVIADVSCPILFIHEEHDELISWDEMRQLYMVSTNPANEFWEVSDAEHSQSYKTHPIEYIQRVDNFLSTLE